VQVVFFGGGGGGNSPKTLRHSVYDDIEKTVHIIRYSVFVYSFI
jgi:hypothetical protein